jgi:hypothetical protein
MAKIIWLKRASRILEERILYANSEFGRFTAKRWMEEIAHIESRIPLMPLSYTPEPLLAGKKHVYRYCHLMNRRFKLIYVYYPSSNTVRVTDIWDTRINPDTLKHHIK